jgi:superfamily II DNA or RNA helicase
MTVLELAVPAAVSASRRPRPRPHQLRALDAVAAVFAGGCERAQLRMACGTGKTLIGPWLAQRLEARIVVVFTPSIALVAQTLDEWRFGLGPLRALAVCSDPTTAAGRAEIGVGGVDPFGGHHDVAGKVTTEAGVVAGFLDGGAGGELRLVVSTYHSAPVVAAALGLTDRCRSIDLLVADEAHHLAGRTDSRFLPVLRDQSIPARCRLFTTATPMVLGNLAALDPIDDLSGAAEQIRCMDDARLFGPVAYTLGVGDAIDAGMLADYRVVVTTPTTTLKGAAAGGPAQRAALGALVDVVERYGLRRILTFHNRVAAAHGFACRVNELGRIGGVGVRAFAVDGSMPDQQRRARLDELADSDSGQVVTVVASAQCLREGVDVPAVDAVVFADPRTSQVGIVQAIGRALRTHPAKSVGTIVIPLVLDPDGDDQEQLADSAYAHVWRVLRGLRAHDARIGFDIDRARVAVGRGEAVDAADIGWLHVVGDDPGAVVARLLQRTSAAWEHYYGQLLTATEKLGSAARITTDSTRLGGWITLQRILFRDGVIDPDRARRLEAVPGWRWQAEAAADERALAVMAQVAAEHGTTADRTRGQSIYAGRTDGLARPLAFWVATQLCKYRDGQLADWLRAGLEALPGWTWEPLDPDDTAGFEAYRSFVAWEGHTDIPADQVEDDVAVGDWIRCVRRRKALGSLPPLLEAMILAVAPTGRLGDRRFSWQPSETWWGIGMDAARQYIARTGTLADLPVGHTEVVDGHEINLYGWITRTRASYHRGQLAPGFADQAQQLAGWVWRAARGGRRVGEPLPGVEHGHRGYRNGCHCPTCLGAGRAYQRAAAASRRQAYRADWVKAHDVCRHLCALLAVDAGTDRSDACFTPGAIAAAAGVPLGLVRKLVSPDHEPRCHGLHRRALLALTAADVRAIRCVPKSRGRKGIQGQNQPVGDPEPTWRILDELAAAGWTTPMLAAALAYTSASKVARSGRPVSFAQAKMVRLHYESLDGDITAPPPPPPRRRRRDGRDVNHPDTEAERWARCLLEQGYAVPRVAARTGLSDSVVAALAACAAEQGR